MTNIQANSKGALSQQKKVCCDRKWEESEHSAETKKVYVAKKIFSRMSTPGIICRDKEAPVVTNETGKKQKFCHDKASSVTTRIIATSKRWLRQRKSFREKLMSQQGDVCRDTEGRRDTSWTNKQGRDM